MEKLVEEFMGSRDYAYGCEIKYISTKEELDELISAEQYLVIKAEGLHSQDPAKIVPYLFLKVFRYIEYHSNEIYVINGSKFKKLYGDFDKVEDDDILIIIDSFALHCDSESGFDTYDFTHDTGLESWILVDYNDN
jgi:hypothetical protein